MKTAGPHTPFIGQTRFLSLMNHLGISGPLNWFIFAMCFIPAALLMWFSYLGRSTNKEGRQ